MARKFLEGTYQFDLHPPLGKFIIAVGIAVFGDTPIGWRVMPLLFGCAMIPLGAALGWYLMREKVAALLLAAVIAGETFLIAYSRIGIMDGILVLLTLATCSRPCASSGAARSSGWPCCSAWPSASMGCLHGCRACRLRPVA